MIKINRSVCETIGKTIYLFGNLLTKYISCKLEKEEELDVFENICQQYQFDIEEYDEGYEGQQKKQQRKVEEHSKRAIA